MAWLDLAEDILEEFADRRGASAPGLRSLGLDRSFNPELRYLRERERRQDPQVRERLRVAMNEWRYRTGRRVRGRCKPPVTKTPEEIEAEKERARAKERARYQAGKRAHGG